MELEEAQGATLRERPRSAHWTFAGISPVAQDCPR